jgi:hypothetical protein
MKTAIAFSAELERSSRETAMLRGFFYRLIMRVAHRFNWHYAPPIYPENDVQLWCKWCGFRMTLPHEDRIARILKHDFTPASTGDSRNG